MRRIAKEEIEKEPGKYDEEGFYCLEGGDFYDPNGYYFDTKGFDASGGRYDDEGVYVPGNLSMEFSRSDKLQALTKEEIVAAHPEGEGKFDEDGFYLLKDGDFFDPFGYYFNTEGFDAEGGSYDNQGYYRAGEVRPLVMSKEEIEKLGLEGEFDEDGFYILKSGEFYDPLGYYFDKHGFDEFGGRYDDQGYYIPPSQTGPVSHRKQALTTDEIKQLHPDGKLDEDGFYLLADNCYFDPLGFYFNNDGLDCNGGRYDDDGYYHPGKPRDKALKATDKADIMAQPGKYDAQGFYQLEKGGFFDQFGHKFDEHGIDESGGFYEDGQYMIADEEYVEGEAEEAEEAEEEYGEEEEYDTEQDKYSLDEVKGEDLFEVEAITNEHVLPATLQVKTELQENPQKQFYIRIANLPEYYTAEDYNKFFAKQVPQFQSAKMMPVVINETTGNVIVQTRDVETIRKLLILHGRKLDGYTLSSWLLGHEHYDADDDYNEQFDPLNFEQQFSALGTSGESYDKPVKKENPETAAKVQHEVIQEDEFEVKLIKKEQEEQKVKVTEEDEFTVTTFTK